MVNTYVCTSIYHTYVLAVAVKQYGSMAYCVLSFSVLQYVTRFGKKTFIGNIHMYNMYIYVQGCMCATRCGTLHAAC